MSSHHSPSATQNSTQSPAHVSLYRKYRPQAFADVVGQDHVVSVLKESLKNNSIGHAYLFCGTRGTGKTSIARIFARALGTTSNDLYEIDAASNTSVDDIRELTEAVYTVPLESKYKVYILDEVHMLSKAAFNAFLKTLEEPPKHVIFILATTETEKLPDTIVSRCEVYNFKKPTTEILKKMVQGIAEKEGFKIESSAAELIALLGDGSFRDTQSTLQKVLSFSGGKGGEKSGAEKSDKGDKGAGKNEKGDAGEITLTEVEKITGAPKAELVMQFVKGLLLKDQNLALESLMKAQEQNLDIKVFAELAMTRLRYVLMKTVSPGAAETLAGDIGAEGVKVCDELAKQVHSKQTAETLRNILGVYHMIGKSYTPTLPLEVVIGML